MCKQGSRNAEEDCRICVDGYVPCKHVEGGEGGRGWKCPDPWSILQTGTGTGGQRGAWVKQAYLPPAPSSGKPPGLVPETPEHTLLASRRCCCHRRWSRLEQPARWALCLRRVRRVSSCACLGGSPRGIRMEGNVAGIGWEGRKNEFE